MLIWHKSVNGVDDTVGFNLVVIAVLANVANKPSIIASFLISSFFRTWISSVRSMRVFFIETANLFVKREAALLGAIFQGPPELLVNVFIFGAKRNPDACRMNNEVVNAFMRTLRVMVAGGIGLSRDFKITHRLFFPGVCPGPASFDRPSRPDVQRIVVSCDVRIANRRN